MSRDIGGHPRVSSPGLDSGVGLPMAIVVGSPECLVSVSSFLVGSLAIRQEEASIASLPVCLVQIVYSM